MQINASTCVGCGRCIPYCTMGCIHYKKSMKKTKVHCYIDEEECVDCGICYRSKACPTDSLYQPVHQWPRSIRGTFSNPLAEHKETRVPGRGTEEMKTCDITDRYKRGFAGIAAEMGRPGVGARLSDVEKVFMALVALDVEFESCNPLTGLLMDKKSGRMNPEVLNEKVLSCIIEMIVPIDRIIEVIDVLEKVAEEVDTVFSIDLTARVNEDLSVPTAKIMDLNKRWYSFNGKTNIGLGKLKVKGADLT
ncbi:MAG TPA: ferredoxin family protein [Clostridiaceae bacterium]|nr:ferredoxin family protein [Clostridiaceae bacterium]